MRPTLLDVFSLIHIMRINFFGDTPGGFNYPYDSYPWNPKRHEGHVNDHTFTEAEWEAYQWNPPSNDHVAAPEDGWPDGPDPDASPKPTWAELDTRLLRAEAGQYR